jgi:hypothetical protein
MVWYGMVRILIRTESLVSVPPDAESSKRRGRFGEGESAEEGQDEDMAVGETDCAVDMFIPLVQLCANQQLFQVNTRYAMEPDLFPYVV